MTIPLIVNGVTWNYPSTGDDNWGGSATGWANAMTNGTLQKSGGLFTLLSDLNVGPSYGLISPYFKSNEAVIAQSGTLRLSNTDFIAWRDSDGDNDITLGVSGEGSLVFSGTISFPTMVTNNLTVAGSETFSNLASVGVVTTNSSGVLATNTYLPAGQFPALTGDIVVNYGTLTTSFRTASANTLIGNPTGSTATIGNIAIGSTLNFTSNTLETNALTGDVTTTANSFATTISNNAVTNAKFRQSAGLSVVGNSSSSTFNVADITGTAGTILSVAPDGSSLSFRTVTSLLDQVGSATGDLMVRGSTGWTVLAPGGLGQILQSQGSGNLPAWIGAGGSTNFVQNLYAGIDFTAGTSTTITLSSIPGSADNVVIFFDGVEQFHSTWSLYSATVTFSSVIPTFTNEIEVIVVASGIGSVTSVGMTGDGTVFNTVVTGSPITNSGTLVPTLHTQTANTFLAGPISGSAVAPTFRSIIAADVPTLNQNTTGTAANITATSNSTLTTLSTLSLPYSQLSGTVPTWNQNTTGTAVNITATSNSTLTTLSALSLPYSQLSGTVPTWNQNTTGTAANITATSNSTLTTLSALSLSDTQVTGTSTQVQYIDSTSKMGGDSTFTFNDTSKTLTASIITTTTPSLTDNSTTVPTTAYVQNQGYGYTGFRNRIINGDMRIDQRNAGASQTITGGQYCVDRFVTVATGASLTGRQVAGASADEQYVYQITGATGITQVDFYQKIESNNIYDLAGSNVTLSCKLSNGLLSTVTWSAFYPTVKDNYTSQTLVATGTFTVNNTPTSYSTTFALPSGAENGLVIVLTVGAQTSGVWQIGKVQLEAGSIKTPFERLPVTTTLGLCQRYFQKSYNQGLVAGTNYVGGAAGQLFGTNGIVGQVVATSNFPVVMRTAPTMIVYDGAGTAGKIQYADGSGYHNGGTFTNTSFDSHMTIGSTGSIYYIAYEYTASAEL